MLGVQRADDNQRPHQRDKSRMDTLKLVALDEDDLNIISAHIQDAVMKTSELTFQKLEKRFVVTMKRFAWEQEKKGFFRRTPHERRLSVLHFDRVLSAKSTGINLTKPDDVLSLLTIRFVPGEKPSGAIELLFAGEATVRLDVECIEAKLSDLGPAWQTPAQPRHGV